jgi:hypothetical protein
VPVLLVVLGTLGYRAVEGWSVFDALYMTVITITTVGFLEVQPLSTEGRTFTMLLALGGVFTMFYAASELIRVMVSGEVRSALGRQRMERSLAELEGHLVVCGFGRMGRLACQEFSTLGLPFVVVDRSADVLQAFGLAHGIPLLGDATSDEVLKRAGVERARGLVTVAASDADNLYITMSARFLNDRLFIVARAEDEGAERKLVRAGANDRGDRGAAGQPAGGAQPEGQRRPPGAGHHHRGHQEVRRPDGLQPRGVAGDRGRGSADHAGPPPAARPPGSGGGGLSARGMLHDRAPRIRSSPASSRPSGSA